MWTCSGTQMRKADVVDIRRNASVVGVRTNKDLVSTAAQPRHWAFPGLIRPHAEGPAACSTEALFTLL